jgi:hypothetical protein
VAKLADTSSAPSHAAERYQQLGFELALLGADGEPNRSLPAEIVAAA